MAESKRVQHGPFDGLMLEEVYHAFKLRAQKHAPMSSEAQLVA